MVHDFLSTLNAVQREAVLHDRGPLLILAGAGTGKTRVLTHRIVQLIRSGVAPESILALTFTEKAALEMQERLDVLLPYGYSELWVKTFHGFCDAILRESGHEIGLDPNYRLLTGTDALLFLKEHWFEFDLKHYRPLGNPLQFLSILHSHFSQLMEEGIEPEVYEGWAQKLPRSIEDPAAMEYAEKYTELARAYARYLTLLPQKSVLDFGALQFFMNRLLQQRPSVLRALEVRFQRILVDEFQDTSTIQSRLVERLAGTHRNLMVVGDDDQSIYRWRGASLKNILEFRSRFPEAKGLLLTENYRSTQPILDASHALIQHNNPHRLEAKEGLNKRLESRLEFLSPCPKPHVIHFERVDQEAQFVVERIRAQVDAEQGIHYKDMAVLVRAAAHATPFLEAFDRARIPYHFSSAQGLYQREVIKDLMAILRFLAHPGDDIALFRILCFPLFELPMEVLFSHLQRAKSLTIPLAQALRRNDRQPDLFSSSEVSDRLLRVLDLLKSLQEQSKTEPTSVLLGAFFKETGYLTSFESSEEVESVQALESIALFSQLIRQFESSHPHSRLLDCLTDLETRAELGDRPGGPEAALDTDTVKVFTLHAAKGLEFETVFIVDLVAQRFPAQHRRDPIEFPADLLSADDEEEKASHLAEERRLFYVGMTRAKRNLFLTHSDYYDGRKRWKPSVFLEELKSGEWADFTEEGAALLGMTRRHLAASDSPAEPPLTFSYTPASGVLTASNTRLQTFQACPLKYKFRYVYHLPELPSHTASFGTTLHNALNAFYAKLKQGNAPTLALLRTCYEGAWISSGYLNRAHLESRKLQGWDVLKTFFEAQSEAWILPEYLEKPFKLRVGQDLILSGRIDRIDRLPDGTYEVIDYKTGALKSDLKLDKDLQLSIYALACERILKIPVSRLSLFFLLDQQKVSTTRTPEQLEATEKELIELGQALRNSTFEATPNPGICGYCDYRLLCEKSMA